MRWDTKLGKWGGGIQQSAPANDRITKEGKKSGAISIKASHDSVAKSQKGRGKSQRGTTPEKGRTGLEGKAAHKKVSRTSILPFRTEQKPRKEVMKEKMRGGSSLGEMVEDAKHSTTSRNKKVRRGGVRQKRVPCFKGAQDGAETRAGDGLTQKNPKKPPKKQQHQKNQPPLTTPNTPKKQKQKQKKNTKTRGLAVGGGGKRNNEKGGSVGPNGASGRTEARYSMSSVNGMAAMGKKPATRNSKKGTYKIEGDQLTKGQ